jgi:hypothetical protein
MDECRYCDRDSTVLFRLPSGRRICVECAEDRERRAYRPSDYEVAMAEGAW